MKVTILMLFGCLLIAPSAFARPSHSDYTSHYSGSGHSVSRAVGHPHSSRYAQGVARDSHGRIARSASAKQAFKNSHPCPATGKSRGACSGYVVDHVKALKRGGADAPRNMQWQTKQAAKARDRVE